MKGIILASLKKIIKHDLISGSFYIFVGSMGANVLAFIFNLFLAHKLNYVDYGVYTALITIVNLVSIPSQSLTTIIVQFATNYLSKKELGHASELFIQSTKVITIIGIFLFALFILFSQSILNFLHISNFFSLLLIALTVSTTYITIVNIAFIQSLLKFGILGFIMFLNGFVKLSLGVLLVLLGLQVSGALIAVFVSFFIPFLWSFYPVRQLILQKRQKVKLPVKSIISYSLPASVAIFSLSMLTSTDIILVKHFFSAQNAGLYSGLSLIGKVIFYFTGPIPMVMFPLLIKRHSEKKSYQNLFYLALLMVIIPSFLIALFYFLFPAFTIKFFLGGRGYLALIPYLGLFGIYLSFFSIVNLIVTFFLSVKKTKVVLITASGAVSQIILLSVFHNAFSQIITISLSIVIVMLIILLLYYFKNYGQSENK